MTDLDNIVEDVRTAVEMSLEDCLTPNRLPFDVVNEIADKVRALITPKFDALQQKIDDKACEVDELEDNLSYASHEVDQAEQRDKDREGLDEWLNMIAIFRQYGGHVSDCSFGYSKEF